MKTPLLRHHGHDATAFGSDRFGQAAETAARFFGTPQYIVGQTIGVVLWIALNVVGIIGRWDPYPFILLNLAFSTQAAYAAPLILLAQTRQAERDKRIAVADAEHREELASLAVRRDDLARRALAVNTKHTREIHKLTTEIHRLTVELHKRDGKPPTSVAA